MSLKKPTNPELLTEVMLLIFRANGALLSAGDRLVTDFGLTSSRWQVLGALYGQGRTVSQVARIMGLTRQSVQRTVDSLLEAGFISSSHNPDHAKAQLISLTSKGKLALLKATDAQKEWSTGIAKYQSRDELTAAASVLKKMIHTINSN
jgi:DNA-binding MarR family transcriptional regulator